MKKYETPAIIVSLFDEENVVTGSATPTAEEVKRIAQDNNGGIILGGVSGTSLVNVVAFEF